MSLAEQLEEAWDEVVHAIPGTFCLDLRSAGRRVASRDPDAQHYPASTIKLPTLMALLHDRTAAPAALGSVVVHDVFPSAAGGTFRIQQRDDQDDETWALLGSEVDLQHLADRMITVSGNLASDLVLERIGFESVRRYLAGLGVGAGFCVERLIGDTAAEDSGITNRVTAAALAALMSTIEAGTDADSATAVGILARQTHRDMIPAGLPADVWSASKGGWVTGVKHDVALVRPETAPPYVLAVCTTSDLPHTEGMELVARLSAVTWEHWTRWHASTRAAEPTP